jgi:hypothetical protein
MVRIRFPPAQSQERTVGHASYAPFGSSREQAPSRSAMRLTQALLQEYVPNRLKSLGLVKCSNTDPGQHPGDRQMATIGTDFPAALRWMDWNAGLLGARPV